MMTRRLFVAAAPIALSGQEERQWLEVTLQRRSRTGWQNIEPGLILNQGDMVRFRFKASFPGFVYVVNYGTSGTSTLLFPTVDTGQQNRVEPEKDYMVPSTAQTSFRISGPPGHDIVYWIVSPVALADEQAQSIVRPQRDYKPPRITPRCDDSHLRARGDCVDSSAGPRAVADAGSLPASLSTLTPRELVIVQNETRTRVSAAASFTRPFIYEYRLPHK